MVFDIVDKDLEKLFACPVCSKNDFDTVAKVNLIDLEVFRTSFCNSCSLVFRSIHPKLNWLEKNWQIRFTEQAKNNEIYFNQNVEDNRYKRYEVIGELIKNEVGLGSSIDIGCGTGFGLLAWQKLGFDVMGLEPDPSRASVGIEKHGLSIEVELLSNFAVNNKKYKFVTSIHSLEHIMNPYEAMSNMVKLMENDGFLFIEVPEFENSVKNWNDALYLGHLSNFSENNLILLASRLDLKPIIKVECSKEKDDGPYLGILFRKILDHDKPFIAQNNITFKNVLSKYKNGVNGLPKGNDLVFSVPELNDLSLFYKPNSEVLTTVTANVSKRQAVYNSKINQICIEEVISEIINSNSSSSDVSIEIVRGAYDDY